MSIRFNGSSRATRTTALPTASTAWSMCVATRLKATRANLGTIFEMLNTGVSGTQLILGFNANTTSLYLGTGEGAYSNTSLYSPALDTPVWIGLTQTGTTLTWAVKLLGSATWDATGTLTGTSFTPNRITIGGANNTAEEMNGSIAALGVWNVAQTTSFLLAQQASSTATDTGNCLSWHYMNGVDVAADLVANYNSTAGDLTSAGTGSTYDTWALTYGVSIAGNGTLPLSAAGSSTVPPWPLLRRRRF